MSEGRTPRHSSQREEAPWSIGAVSRSTGIGTHTLRAWEQRFGFPRPRRLSSGHRRYTSGDVSRLRLIAAALALGHRAGDVVRLPVAELERLCGKPDLESSSARAWVEACSKMVLDRRRTELVGALRREVAALGAVPAIEQRFAPLLEEVGHGWARGDLTVGHEHFVSEVVEDVLRQALSTLESGCAGAPVVLATLPGERHALGMRMAALQIASCGRSVHILGADTPVREIVEAARHLRVPAVALSITGTTPEPQTGLAELRCSLPRGVRIFIGGAGASTLPRVPQGVEKVRGLRDLVPLIQSLPSPGPEGDGDASRGRPAIPSAHRRREPSRPA